MKKLICFMVVSVVMAQEPKNISYVSIDSIVRPNNATAYTINDVVNDTNTTARLFRFKWSARSAMKSGIIVSSVMEIDTGNSTSGSYRLLLFNDSVATVADHAAWVGTQAHNAKFIGYIDYSLELNQTAGAGTAIAQNTGLVIPFLSSTQRGDGYIYGVLVAKAAATPKTYGKYRIKLGILRD